MLGYLVPRPPNIPNFELWSSESDNFKAFWLWLLLWLTRERMKCLRVFWEMECQVDETRKHNSFFTHTTLCSYIDTDFCLGFTDIYCKKSKHRSCVGMCVRLWACMYVNVCVCEWAWVCVRVRQCCIFRSKSFLFSLKFNITYWFWTKEMSFPWISSNSNYRENLD